MADKLAERVLCFECQLLERLGRFQGITTDVARYFAHITKPENTTYIPRREAENDDRHKQLIPYAIFIHEDTVFRYRRGKRGGEQRLHALYSIGIGGHIVADDRLLFSKDAIGYEDAMWREIHEEVSLQSPQKEACVALINDDSTDVGRYHFGVVHMILVKEPRLSKNDSCITEFGFVNLERAMRQPHGYESWSELCLRNMVQLLERARDAWSSQEWR